MSKYTTELRYICEFEAGLTESKGFDDIDDIITEAAPKIFNFDFPIFDEQYRLPLEKKILLHYYTREIGQETYGLWKLKLCSRMNDIMPYYNKLYESELLNITPLQDNSTSISINDASITSSQNSNTRTGSGSQSGTNGSEDLYSDTPQGDITGITSKTYLTNARKIDGTSSSSYNDSDTNTGSTNGTSNRTYSETRTGTTKSQSKLLEEYRKTFMNIDKMVIDELKDLFFLLW